MRAENIIIRDVLVAHKLNSPVITETDAKVNIIFAWSDVLFHQQELQAIWRELNSAKAKPIAKTFLGRIKSISYQKQS